jgi:replicative DNA helicase
VAKNRNGPTSDINLLFNPGLTRFENPAKDYRNNE